MNFPIRKQNVLIFPDRKELSNIAEDGSKFIKF